MFRKINGSTHGRKVAPKKMGYPLVNMQKAIEHGIHGHRNSGFTDLPIKCMVIIHSYVNVYQAGYITMWFIPHVGCLNPTHVSSIKP
jgi:hypothetical protein